MAKIKATKSSLHRLVGEYVDVPKLKSTEFRKAIRTRSYWLFWSTVSGRMSAYFSVAGGAPFLRITEELDDGGGADRFYNPDADHLREIGLLE